MLFKAFWFRGCLFVFAVAFFVAVGMAKTARTNSGQFVGTEACAECHDEEYANYKKFSKKAHSSNSVKVMAKDLSKEELEECYVCHMTGFGKPGGFVGFEETPDMADAGCEVCHGPGYDHVEAGGDSDLIKGDLEERDSL